MHEAERVVTQREVRAELDGALERVDRAPLFTPKPQGASHRPVGGRVANVRIDAAARRLERELDLAIAIRDEVEKRVLEVREGESGVRAREGRIEAQRP